MEYSCSYRRGLATAGLVRLEEGGSATFNDFQEGLAPIWIVYKVKKGLFFLGGVFEAG